MREILKEGAGMRKGIWKGMNVKNVTGKVLNAICALLKKYTVVIVAIVGMLVVIAICVLDSIAPRIELWETVSIRLNKVLEFLLAYAAIAVVYAEIRQNKQISEAQLVKELNSEFINNESLVLIEHKLEIYYSQYSEAQSAEERAKLKLDLNLDRESYQRQYLVNYLVHLEAVASLVNANILRLKVINELVAYRFFIAMNNPDIQSLELGPYKDYYMGCYKLHKKWTKYMHKLEKQRRKESGNNNLPGMIPMEENGKFFEDRK